MFLCVYNTQIYKPIHKYEKEKQFYIYIHPSKWFLKQNKTKKPTTLKFTNLNLSSKS